MVTRGPILPPHMADLHPPETNCGATAPPAAPPGVLDSTEANAAAAGQAPAPHYSKRRRRPSVRLGDIGVQPTASDVQLQLPRQHRKPSSSSHPRRAHPDDVLDPAARRGHKSAQRRPRTAWIPAPPDPNECVEEEGHHYDDGDRSDSAAARARVSGSREASIDDSDGVADWGLPNGRLLGTMAYGGVKAWLLGLGLARYAPVFEIHEVDDQVLPLLTLDDLKDMGISAVGSRRKMHAAIQKLRGSDMVS